MGDVQSGMASTIMQVYLKHVLEAFFTGRSQVRLEALNVIQLVLRQGLIHPVQVCFNTQKINQTPEKKKAIS